MYKNDNIATYEDVIDKLLEIDFACERNELQAELMLLGGSALILFLSSVEIDCRPTRDIDLKILSANTEADVRKIIQELDMDLVDGVIELPPIEDFRDGDKYEISVGFRAIKVFVPTVELFVITKIFSTRQKDLDDLLESRILELCDNEKLINMVLEYKHDYLNLANPDLNYHIIIKQLNETA